jgi:hypothetical protein
MLTVGVAAASATLAGCRRRDRGLDGLWLRCQHGNSSFIEPAGAPTSTAATQTSISLSWSAAAAMPTGAAITYQVERQPAAGGSWVAGCTATHATPSTATSCTDSGLAAGTGYKYRIVSAFEAWRAAGAESTTLSTQVAPS